MARKVSRTVKLLLVVVIIAIPLGADRFWRRIDQWRYPWGYESGDRPTLIGTWDGADALAVVPALHWQVGRGSHARQGDPNITVNEMPMQRGTQADYHALCTQLTQRHTAQRPRGTLSD